MGNVLTTNIGPNGEEIMFYSACGPIVDKENPDYGYDPAYEGVELCVKAGELDFGPLWEQKAAIGLVWFTIISSIGLFIFYVYQTYRATCGWEEMYVCTAETLKVLIEMKLEFDSPAMLYQVNGAVAPWIRYAEWLLTCPVILIHLSNLTGLSGEYSKRTMFLLVSDLGTIVWGVSAANALGPPKAIFFLVGLCYACNTFFHAAKVYIESYHAVPKGKCKNIVKILAYMFFASWAGFPASFIAGPEGTKVISYAGSTIAHTFADLLSKNLWGFIANYLRVCIHRHIIMYGDIRKTTVVKVAGQDVEVQEYVTEEDDDTIKHSTADLASRGSFILMRNDMESRGINVRASLDMSGQVPDYAMQVMQKNNNAGMGGMALAPGRVILGVADASTVDVFKNAFSQLPAAIEVVPCMGPLNVWTTVQQANAEGGFDFVLLHPEYLRDQSGSSLLRTLKANNVKIAAYGWEANSFVAQVIQQAGVQGYISGPNQMGLDVNQLFMLVARMQSNYQHSMHMGGMGGGGGGMGGMGGMGQEGLIPAGMQNMGAGGSTMGGAQSGQGDSGWYGGMGVPSHTQQGQSGMHSSLGLGL